MVVGLSGYYVSVLLFGLQLMGSASGFAVGWWLSSSRASASDYVRLQLFAAIGSAGLLALQFLLVTPAAVILSAFAFRAAFAAQEVPQNALALLLPKDENEAGLYARIHVVLSSIARLVVISAHALPLSFDTAAVRMGTFACVSALTMVSAFILLGVRFPSNRVPPSGFSWGRVRPDLLAILAAFALSTMMMPTLTRLLIFLPNISGHDNFASLMVAAYFLGSATGPILHARLTDRISGRNLSLLSALTAIGSGFMVIAPLSPMIREAAAFAHGIALSMIVVRLWAAAAIAARRDASDGLVSGAIALTMHVSGAIGALLLGPLMEPFENGGDWATLAAVLLMSIGVVSVAAIGIRQRTTSAWA